jgi:hypothetical protein
MTGLVIGIALGIFVCYRLGYYNELIARLRPKSPDNPPNPNTLACGECVWLLPAAFPENRSPGSLVDQLIISPFCTEHNTFAWKRWGEKHLDDKGIVDKYPGDVDNYRGFLEGD